MNVLQDCFDVPFYLAKNKDIPQDITPEAVWEHFSLHGQHEGRTFRCVQPPCQKTIYPVILASIYSFCSGQVCVYPLYHLFIFQSLPPVRVLAVHIQQFDQLICIAILTEIDPADVLCGF